MDNMRSERGGSNTELEAAAFRKLLAQLDSRKDVQHIELIIMAGFCRNCLSKWYKPLLTRAALTWTWRMQERRSMECPTLNGSLIFSPRPLQSN